MKKDLEHALANDETDCQDTALGDEFVTEVKSELIRIGRLGETKME
jgi:hypothetical protein